MTTRNFYFVVVDKCNIGYNGEFNTCGKGVLIFSGTELH